MTAKTNNDSIAFVDALRSVVVADAAMQVVWLRPTPQAGT